MPGTILTVASGKGGVGKTTTAVNLAVALWRRENSVALVDADLGMANVAAVLGIEPEETLHDVLAGRASVEAALVEAQDGDLLVLPGARDLAGFAEADPDGLGSVLEALAGRCDFVVVDTGAGLSYEDVLPLGLADLILLVTTPDAAAVGDTRKTLEISGLLEGPVRGVVVTRVHEGTDAEAVAAAIGTDLLAAIPEDPAVTRSTLEGDPLESHAPDAPATSAYRELAAAIDEGPDDQPAAADAAGTDAESADATGTAGAATGGGGEEASANPGDAVADEEAPAPAEGSGRHGDEEPAADPEAGPEADPTDDAAEAGDTPDAGPSDADGSAEDAEPTDDDGSADGGETESAPSDADGSVEDAKPAEDDGSADGDETESADSGAVDGADDPDARRDGGRGGPLGWLGRLFS